MKCTLALALGLIVCLPCMAATAASTSCDSVSTSSQQVNEETVRRIEQGWITAEYRGNRQFLECLLEPDYRTSGKSGQVRTRQDVIDHVSLTTDMSKPIPALQTIVFIHGNSATAHSIMKTTDKDGNPREVHFVDGYTFHDGRWFAYSGADF